MSQDSNQNLEPGQAELFALEADVHSCGFIIFRKPEQQYQFLLMLHADRWDLPKGHVDPGETKMQCALRELHEETGIQQEHIIVDDHFEYRHRYYVVGRSGKQKLKELTIYLAYLQQEIEILITEHIGSRWFDWQPPHKIEARSIDGLLVRVQNHGLR